MKTVTRLTAAVALAATLGCESAPQPPAAHPVAGEVIYDGKPAAGVKVFFFPETGVIVPPPPSNPHGVTGPDGRFSLSTYGDKDGAPEGGYQVILLWPAEQKQEGIEVNEDRLFGWYDARHSKLTARVAAGPNTLPAFKLAAVNGPPPVSQGVPGRN